jgi:flagellar biosynthesis/type III secretory pathway protein FliH
MTTSKAPPGAPSSSPPGVPPGAAPGAGHNYTRFIPREELGPFAAWNPASLEDPGQPRGAPGESAAGGGVHKAPFSVRAGVPGAQGEPVAARSGAAHSPDKSSKPVAGKATQATGAKATESAAQAPAPDVDKLVKEARQAGYQDGYRDGLSALESYKQAQVAQMAAFMSDQVGGLVAEMHARLESVEQQLSGRIAGVALELARQVVRSEIALRPELVVAVAEEAMGTLLSSARQVMLRLHPDDHALAQGVLEEKLSAMGARAVADVHVAQGGCVIESDIAVVDASVEARWDRAAAAMGMRLGWDEPAGAAPAHGHATAEDDSEWLDDMAAADAAREVGA